MSVAPDTAALRKARGAFFTPPALSRYVAEWAIRTPDDLVLEPSCGEAAFLLAAGERLAALRGASPKPRQLSGVELHAASATQAQRELRAASLSGSVTTGDFFHFTPRACYDAVIGNPPYVRYQNFTGAARKVSRSAALAQGVRLTGLASSWAAFTVHAALFLRPGGRLGLVLPAELLSVNYAAEVRAFLMRRFARVRLVLFEERVFPEVQEEVVLLLAEGEGPTDHCELVQVPDALALERLDLATYSWQPPKDGGKWTPALLSTDALEVYRAVESDADFTTLSAWGRVTLGSVTGRNDFFALTAARMRELGLQDSDVLPLSPPGSKHLRTASLTTSGWRRLADTGAEAFLFWPRQEPSEAAKAYIAAGETMRIHEGYKCRNRDPWWRVPLSPIADVFVTYMNANLVQLASNRVQVRHLNSVHGLVLSAEQRALGRDLLPLASLNSMTLLGSEIVGRSYGGGMLKLEPREAAMLPVTTPALLRGPTGKQLRQARPVLAKLLAGGDTKSAIAIVDDIVLINGLNVDAASVQQLRLAREVLASRRATRGRGGRNSVG